VTTTDPIHAFYQDGNEDSRLREGAGRLELLRTQDILRRVLPTAPARILDVGGGTGVHARWLAEDGHHVDLIEPIPSHVELAARIPGVSAHLGDARTLEFADECCDVVLLLGPLYHLPAPEDRVRVLAEARRVLHPGGTLVAATINRYAGVHDTLSQGRYFDPARRPRIEAAAADGNLRPSENSLFTTAYFHQPPEIAAEVAAAGFGAAGQYGIEGAAWLMGGITAWLDDPEQCALVLRAMRITESDPSLLGVSGHLLTAGVKPATVG
jgi:SAM-dependent methyltransferase